ncbi:hypothetical protein [Zobellella sp. An-6]|uniref:hypothetical protein n=1 Tax=Zobellella sp. An-6 TaxID=3400218 RepID=UPI004041A610
MSADWLVALEATALAGALRNSVWVYPLVNAAHILGVALLVGAIVPLDLRLLGAWRSVALAPLWRVLTRTAGAGLALAIVCGSLLFITRATEYAASGLFISKMAVVAMGTANALALRWVRPVDPERILPAGAKPPGRVRLAGGVSLAAWLTALTLGRLVGYF